MIERQGHAWPVRLGHPRSGPRRRNAPAHAWSVVSSQWLVVRSQWSVVSSPLLEDHA